MWLIKIFWRLDNFQLLLPCYHCSYYFNLNIHYSNESNFFYDTAGLIRIRSWCSYTTIKKAQVLSKWQTIRSQSWYLPLISISGVTLLYWRVFLGRINNTEPKCKHVNQGHLILTHSVEGYRITCNQLSACLVGLLCCIFLSVSARCTLKSGTNIY